MTDAQLLKQWIDHASDDAISQLVRRHSDAVYSIALRRLGDPSLAEDVTQAAFMVLTQRAGSLRNQTCLLAWLHQVTRRASVDAMRRRMTRDRHESIAAEQSKPVYQDTFDEWAEIREHLEPALDALSNKDREAIVMRFYEGKTFKEIATKRSIAVGTAHRQVQKALRNLTALLKKRGVAMPATSLASLLGANAVNAAPSSLVTHSTTLAVTGGSLEATLASSNSMMIAKGVLSMFFLEKIRFAATVAFIVLLIPAVSVPVIYAQSSTLKNAAPASGSTPPDASQGITDTMPEITGAATVFRVRDIQASTKFYNEVLGFATLTNDGFGYVATKRDIAYINLTTYDMGKPAGGGMAYIYCNDVDQVYQQIKQSGGKFAREIGDRYFGFRDFTILDPDGNMMIFGSPLR